MIIIDEKKCTKCNLCHKVCTKGVIQPGPTIDSVKSFFCMNCGHCYAVCPQGAINLGGVSAGDGESRPAISSADMMNLLKFRRSGRFYKPEPVSREHLQRIIEAASVAPSAKNLHRVKAYVYTDQQIIEQINQGISEHFRKLLKLFAVPGFPLIWKLLGFPPKLLKVYKNDFQRIAYPASDYSILHNTPTLLVFTVPNKDEMSVADGWIAAQNAVIYCETIGVGACYNGYLSVAAGKHKNLKSTMRIPAKEHVISALTLGYPTVTFRRPAPRRVMETIFINQR